MKRVVLLSVLAVVTIALWNCRGDRIIEAPPSLIGDYVGWYIYKHGNTPPESMCVTVWFTNDEFHMRRDSATCPDRERKACDADGKYDMPGRVVIFAEDSQDSNATAKICVLERAPFSAFDIKQPEGKLILESSTSSGDERVYKALDLSIVK